MEIQNLKSGKIRGPTMQLSIHYYVLSLSEQTTRLYEGFRDKLIDIQNTHFPFTSSSNTGNPGLTDTRLRYYFLQTDQHFDHYYNQDPHQLVVVGEKINLDKFKEVSSHHDQLVGMVEGNYTDTSSHDLGKIVWPVVKEIMAGTNQNAMRDLATATEEKKIVLGIDAVGQSAETETGSTLYVEEDYHVKGSIRKTDHSLIISQHVGIWDVIDNVVDLIIEKVLKMDGNVIFLKRDSLVNLERIALILNN